MARSRSLRGLTQLRPADEARMANQARVEGTPGGMESLPPDPREEGIASKFGLQNAYSGLQPLTSPQRQSNLTADKQTETEFAQTSGTGTTPTSPFGDEESRISGGGDVQTVGKFAVSYGIGSGVSALTSGGSTAATAGATTGGQVAPTLAMGAAEGGAVTSTTASGTVSQAAGGIHSGAVGTAAETVAEGTPAFSAGAGEGLPPTTTTFGGTPGAGRFGGIGGGSQQVLAQGSAGGPSALSRLGSAVVDFGKDQLIGKTVGRLGVTGSVIDKIKSGNYLGAVKEAGTNFVVNNVNAGLTPGGRDGGETEGLPSLDALRSTQPLPRVNQQDQRRRNGMGQAGSSRFGR